MIGAVIYKVENGVLTGELIEDSLAIWCPTSSGAPAGRPPTDPVKRAAYEARKTKYQGNNTSEIFEDWFDDNCASLSHLSDLTIYMDNAGIHKRETWGKAEAMRWLRRKGVSVPNSISKMKLKGLLKSKNITMRFKVVQIAASYGFGVVFTTPYCPWQQPIETFWAVGKNKCAQICHPNMVDLKNVLYQCLEEANTQKVLLGAWKLTLKAEEGQRIELGMDETGVVDFQNSENLHIDEIDDSDAAALLDWEYDH